MQVRPQSPVHTPKFSLASLLFLDKFNLLVYTLLIGEFLRNKSPFPKVVMANFFKQGSLSRKKR